MTFAGDNLIPDAVMVYDQKLTVKAAAVDVYPWLMQVGKGRGGWYLSERAERFLPASWRAARCIEPQWQGLAINDRVEDYGFDSSQDFFIVASVDPPRSLVFRSDRYGCHFSWALLVHEAPDKQSSEVHLRFRGMIQAQGLKRWLIVTGGGFMDWLSTRPLLAGLKERAERSHTS